MLEIGKIEPISAAPTEAAKKLLAGYQVVGLRRRAGAGEPKATLAREFGIGRETLYQYLKVAPPAA